MKRFPRLLVTLAALVLTLPIAACSAQSGNFGPQMHSEGSPTELRDVAAAPFDSTQPTSGLLGAGNVSAEATADLNDRSIIKSGNIELEVDSASKSVAEITKVTADFDGTVISQQLWGNGGTAKSGSVTVTVPSDKFDAAMDHLGTLGTVRSEQRSSDDVTTQHVDLTARVAALETSVTRLKELMEGASSMSDLLEIESMLAARQAELDGLTAQLKSLEGQITESSIFVSLAEQSVLPGGGPKTFWEALTAGVASIGAFASSAIIVIGVALPWLVIAGVVAAAVFIPVRARRRRRIARGANPVTEPVESTDSVAEHNED